MSVRAMTAVWEWSTAPDLATFVFALALADNCDNDGVCRDMSVATLSEQARMVRSTGYRCLRRLEKIGEIVTQRRGGARPGDTNTYRLSIVDNLSKRGPPHGPVDGSERGPKGVRAVGHTTTAPIDTKPRVRARGTDPSPVRHFTDDPDNTDPVEIPDNVTALRSAMRGRRS